MKRSELSEAELACLEYYESITPRDEILEPVIYEIGGSISEQLEPEVEMITVTIPKPVCTGPARDCFGSMEIHFGHDPEDYKKAKEARAIIEAALSGGD